MRKKRILIIVLLLFIIIVGIFSYYANVFFQWADNTEVKMVGKTHVDFFVSSGQLIDYKDFMFLSEETKQLGQISQDVRQQISDYMKENNLKLKEGHHYFNRINGTYEEYISDNFKFEKK